TLQHLERRLRIECGIDTIIREWRPQVHCAAALALGRCIGRPVAVEHLRCRDICNGSLRICSLYCRLQTRKKEQLALYEGAAYHTDKLMPFQRIFFSSKRVPRVEHAVAPELEDTAMKFVAAPLRNDIDRACSVKSVLGGDSARLNFEFLQRIRKRQR